MYVIAEFKGDWTKMRCGGCERFMEAHWAEGFFCCGGIPGFDTAEKPLIIAADRPACKEYWDREEQKRLDEQNKERQEQERLERWKKNIDNAPLPAKWERDWDGGCDCWTGYMPFCPNCGEPLYEPERCYFCGQAILLDERMEAYNKPPEVKIMDCFSCGGIGTVEYTESRYNGHKRGHCTKCGMRFIE